MEISPFDESIPGKKLIKEMETVEVKRFIPNILYNKFLGSRSNLITSENAALMKHIINPQALRHVV